MRARLSRTHLFYFCRNRAPGRSTDASRQRDTGEYFFRFANHDVVRFQAHDIGYPNQRRAPVRWAGADPMPSKPA